MVGFEKALGAVEVIKNRIQYRSQSLINLARGYFIKYVDTNATLSLLNFAGLISTKFANSYFLLDPSLNRSKQNP